MALCLWSAKGTKYYLILIYQLHHNQRVWVCVCSLYKIIKRFHTIVALCCSFSCLIVAIYNTHISYGFQRSFTVKYSEEKKLKRKFMSVLMLNIQKNINCWRASIKHFAFNIMLKTVVHISYLSNSFKICTCLVSSYYGLNEKLYLQFTNNSLYTPYAEWIVKNLINIYLSTTAQ